MSITKEVYKFIQYTNLINEQKKDLYSKLLELKSKYPNYFNNFNKQCIVNNVKIKEIENNKWIIVEIINNSGCIEFLNIPENLTKLKSVEYEYMRQSLFSCKSQEDIEFLLNSKNNIKNLYLKKFNKDKELKLFLKKHLY